MSDGQANGAAQQWRERSVNVTGTIVDFTKGGVQLIGRAPLAIDETVVAIGFAALFQIVGQVLQLMDARHPAHADVRRALLDDLRQLALPLPSGEGHSAYCQKPDGHPGPCGRDMLTKYENP